MVRHRLAWAALLLLVFGLTSSLQAKDDKDPLLRARQLYNQKQFDAAIAAADQAHSQPAVADAADLIAARAMLERFRQTATPADLDAARSRLQRLDPQRLAPAERNDFIVGIGEALYLDKEYGAAADVFGSMLSRPDVLAGDARERVLDWWATAVDREARPRLSIERQAYYQRVRARMLDEIGLRPSSTVAMYWLAAAAHGQGDFEAAWSASQAGWVRATLAPDHGVALRADLDKLVREALIPDRSKTLGQPAEALRASWDRYVAAWSR